MIALFGGLLLATGVGLGVQVPIQSRPAWVVDGVPDSVWVLVEASTGTDEEDDMRALLRRAEVHARTALVDHADDVGRRFALAVVLGLRANREGGRTKVNAAADLHRELETILEVDPDHARARHMLGRLHAGVRRMNAITRWIATNLLGGGELKKATWEEAERNLTFAEERVPGVSEHHLQLANLYADTDRPELALQELEHVFQLPATSPMELATRDEALALQELLLNPPTRRSLRTRSRGGSPPMTTLLMLGALFAGAVASSLVPLVNAEAIVLATALAVPSELALVIVLAVTLGQVTGKVVLYCSGKGIGNLATSGKSQRAFAMARRLRGKQGRLRLAFFASASVGLPPLYIMAPVAGIGRMPMPTFLSLCFIGRFIRFYALFLAPGLL